MTKKITIIIGLLLVTTGVGLWFYLSSSKDTSVEPDSLTNVLPFGSGEGEVSTSIPTGNNSGTTAGTKVSNLFKLSDVPVSGAVAFNKNGSLIVRYVERATGHIVEMSPVSLAKTKIVNTTTPKVYEAIWKSDGTNVIFRTLRDNEIIETTNYTLIPPSGTSTSDTYTTKSSSLPANISDIAAGTEKVFYIVKNLPSVTSSLFDGTKTTIVWSSNFDQWALSSAGDSKLLLTSKVGGESAGYTYEIVAGSGSAKKLFGPVKSLSSLANKNGDWVAYSHSKDGSLVMSTLGIKEGVRDNLPVSTFTDKCVWGTKNVSTLYCAVPNTPPSSQEPELWNKGMSRFIDVFWKFDLYTGFNTHISDPRKEFGVNIDAEKLFLSPDEDYLFFTNKNDLTLWALKLVD
jgi:hypothetical protein